MKTVFLGTPEPAVPFLLKTKELTDLRLAVTNPDKPAGRGLKIAPCPVKSAAVAAGVPVLSPEKPSELITRITEIAPDVGVAVAYGHFLKSEFLATAKYGYINIHFSLLPKFRGAAPVQWSLIDGETETGVTAFWIDKGMDTGDIILQEKLPVAPEDDAVTLMKKLSGLGVEVLAGALEKVGRGEIVRIPQTGTPSHARLFTKEDAWLDFTMSAFSVHNKIRGLALGPRPKALLKFADGREMVVCFIKTSPRHGGTAGFLPGQTVRVEKDGSFIIQCIDNTELCVREIRPEGRNTMSGRDFAAGFRLQSADAFINGIPGRS
ncbi:MAG: methionyl-tRNA formyltransferase [Elusimicrobiaceae bacterium]